MLAACLYVPPKLCPALVALHAAVLQVHHERSANDYISDARRLSKV
jgi:hypothetical protein